MKNILIFGAGSIGNHMSNACISLGWRVFVTDKNPKALLRMKKVIYPKRYKKWNTNIAQINYKDVYSLKKIFDLIIIGTPPTSHYEIFKNCKKNLLFDKILIEKPISNFQDKSIFNLVKKQHNIKIFCGYNHSVNPSMSYFFDKIRENRNKIKFVNISWREGWDGILGAHPWLKNEFDSYLGNYKEGGGAIQEHSHGIHALVCILDLLKIKKFDLLGKSVFFKKKGNKKYDYFANIFAEIKNIFFKYETDLITFPPEKNIYIKLDNGYLKWICNFKKNTDAVIFQDGNKYVVKNFSKTRSSEFVNELKHINKITTKKKYEISRINIYNALNTFKIIQNTLIK